MNKGVLKAHDKLSIRDITSGHDGHTPLPAATTSLNYKQSSHKQKDPMVK